MKKIILLVALLFLTTGLISCGGGGGSGSADQPPGENPGGASVVQLWPSHFIAQTNAYITLYAKVLDGNGAPVPNIDVTFTNISGTGTLSKTSAKTDGTGLAQVTLSSSTSGFSTILAQINTSQGIARDNKTVFFTTSDTATLSPTLSVDVDGDGDGTYNESSDFILFENTNDNNVNVRATVSNAALPISGSSIIFGADRPYKVGSAPDATCSDGSSTCDVIFPAGNTAITNSQGRATIPVRVEPSTLSPLPTTLNITAQADVGAFNMVTLFLNPVSINTVTVHANPQTVASKGTSKIKAYVTTTAGTPAPDGTTVTFTVSGGGGIDPFSQTTNGWTGEITFTAPEVTSDTTATVTASVGGKTGSVVINIKAPVTPPAALAITPTTVTVTESATTAQTQSFQVTGGVPPYNITSSNSVLVFNDNGGTTGTPNDGIRNGDEGGTWTVSSSGGVLTATIPQGDIVGTDTDVTLTVTDSGGSPLVTATIKIKQAI